RVVTVEPCCQNLPPSPGEDRLKSRKRMIRMRQVLNDLRAGDLDAEPFKSHEMAFPLGEQADRGHAEILQALRVEPDAAPLRFALDGLFMAFRVADAIAPVLVRDADRTLAQIDQNAPALLAHALRNGLQLALHAEHV